MMDMMATDRRDVSAILLDRINMMDMMSEGSQGCLTDSFRRDQHDGHDGDRSQGCLTDTFRQDQHDGHDFASRAEARKTHIFNHQFTQKRRRFGGVLDRSAATCPAGVSERVGERIKFTL